MPSGWLRDKMPEFVRDVFRGFCLAAECLEGQATLFDQETRVEFKVLDELLGQVTNKGLLWRLKDTAHHVFRARPDATAVGRFLDWGMGYIFHETMKLKEDSYQLLNYGPMFENLLADPMPELETQVGDELFKVLSQTKESMRREIDRIRFIMAQCRKLLPVYLSGYAFNPLVARFIFMDNELVRRVFGGGVRRSGGLHLQGQARAALRAGGPEPAPGRLDGGGGPGRGHGPGDQPQERTGAPGKGRAGQLAQNAALVWRP